MIYGKVVMYVKVQSSSGPGLVGGQETRQAPAPRHGQAWVTEWAQVLVDIWYIDKILSQLTLLYYHSIVRGGGDNLWIRYRGNYSYCSNPIYYIFMIYMMVQVYSQSIVGLRYRGRVSLQQPPYIDLSRIINISNNILCDVWSEFFVIIGFSCSVVQFVPVSRSSISKCFSNCGWDLHWLEGIHLECIPVTTGV